MQTPIVYGEILYVCRDNGVLSAFDAKTGARHVVKAGTTFELLGTNPLGEVAMATPAISEGTLLFRTRNHLVAVGER